MKKWLFLFMTLFTYALTSCNANFTTDTNLNTTSISTSVTTNGGTISESTIYTVEFVNDESSTIPDRYLITGELVVEPNVTKMCTQ